MSPGPRGSRHQVRKWRRQRPRKQPRRQPQSVPDAARQGVPDTAPNHEGEGGGGRDANNAQVVSARFVRMARDVLPWLGRVALAGGSLTVMADVLVALRTLRPDIERACLPQSANDPKTVGQTVLRMIEAIMDIALPELAAPAPAPREDTAGPRPQASTPVREDAGGGQGPPQDGVYAGLRLDEDGPGEQIRLLDLLPGRGADGVRATLFVIRSPRHHKYEAISYVWGPQGVQHPIRLNGRPYSVGTNLHDALVSLRLPDRPRRLWVDAVCINQRDDDEKAAQVARMGAIYRAAWNVAIFLGMPTAQSDALLAFLNRDKRTADDDDNVAGILDECGLDGAAVVAGVVELCGRAWWDRLWVLQEHFLATRTPVWYIGARFFEGNKLRRDVLALAGHTMERLLVDSVAPLAGVEEPVVVASRTRIHIQDMLARLFYTVFLRRERPAAYEVPGVLFSNSVRTATHPADYVYGVREMLEPLFRHVFVPDYKLPVPRLFEKLAAWFLLVDGWADMLWSYPSRYYAAAGALGGGGWEGPSWVPDFSRGQRKYLGEPEPSGARDRRPTKTAQCAIVDRVLYVEGCRLDDVDRVVPISPGSCFRVLERLWRLDRIYCSNQRQVGAVQRDRCALFVWGSSTASDVPVFPPGRHEMHQMMLYEIHKFEQTWAGCDASARTAGLSAFLSREMEGGFLATCVFDYENLGAQLEMMSEAAGFEQGLALVLSRYGPNDIVYADLMHAIHTNSGPAEENMFGPLVALVSRVASRIHNWFQIDNSTGDSSSMQGQAASSFRIVKKLVDGQKTQIRTLEAERHDDMADLAGVEVRIARLKHNVADMERRLKWRADKQPLHRWDDSEWSPLDRQLAMRFEGRQFFVTKGGLLGVTSPGVSGVRAGDQIVLLDGLSFPLVARARPASRLVVVGCANVREVKMGDKVEDVELWDGVTVGAKRMLEFE